MKRLLVTSSLYGASAALLKLIGIAVLLWLAGRLTVDEYATFGLYYALQQGVATFALAGIIESTVGLLRDARTDTQTRELFAQSHFGFLTVASVLTCGISLAYLAFAHEPTSSAAFFSALTGGLLLAYASYHSQIVRLQDNHALSILLTTIPPVAGLLGGALGVTLYRTPAAFFIGTSAAVAVSLALMFVRRNTSVTVLRNRSPCHRIIKSAWPYMIVACLGWLSGYGTNFIIQILLHRAEVAKFTFALGVCSILLLISGAVSQAWSPRFYQLIHIAPSELVEQKNALLYSALALLLGAVGGVLVISLPVVLGLIGGNLATYRAMNLELSLLFGGYVILASWWQCSNYFYANGMGMAILKITLWTSVIGIPMLVAATWLLGALGIYLGFIVQMTLRTTAIVAVAKKQWHVEVDWTGTGLGLLMIFVGWVVSTTSPSFSTSVAVYSSAIITLAGLVWRRARRELLNGVTAVDVFASP